jgi:hypothetical protein
MPGCLSPYDRANGQQLNSQADHDMSFPSPPDRILTIPHHAISCPMHATFRACTIFIGNSDSGCFNTRLASSATMERLSWGPSSLKQAWDTHKTSQWYSAASRAPAFWILFYVTLRVKNIVWKTRNSEPPDLTSHQMGRAENTRLDNPPASQSIYVIHWRVLASPIYIGQRLRGQIGNTRLHHATNWQDRKHTTWQPPNQSVNLIWVSFYCFNLKPLLHTDT